MMIRIIVTIVALMLAGCSVYEDSSAENRARIAAKATGDIVIGAAGPLEEISFLQQGITLAVDEINAQGGLLGGRKLKIIFADDKSSIDRGQIIAQEFAENSELVAVIGHVNSYISIPTSIMYQYYGIVMLSPLSTNIRLTSQGYDKIFRNIPNDVNFARQVAEYCSENGLNRIMIYHQKDDYGQGLSNAFEIESGNLGLTIVDRLAYDSYSDPRHFNNDLNYWRNIFPFDAIFLAGLMPKVAEFVIEARKMGIDVPIIGSDALDTPYLLELAGEYAEGVCVPSVYHPSIKHPKNQAFVRKFIELYQAPPDFDGAQGYDAVYVLAEAITRAGSTVPDKIANALHNLKDYDGLTGSYSFDENGDVSNRMLFMKVVKNGNFEFVLKLE